MRAACFVCLPSPHRSPCAFGCSLAIPRLPVRNAVPADDRRTEHRRREELDTEHALHCVAASLHARWERPRRDMESHRQMAAERRPVGWPPTGRWPAIKATFSLCLGSSSESELRGDGSIMHDGMACLAAAGAARERQRASEPARRCRAVPGVFLCWIPWELLGTLINHGPLSPLSAPRDGAGAAPGARPLAESSSDRSPESLRY